VFGRPLGAERDSIHHLVNGLQYFQFILAAHSSVQYPLNRNLATMMPVTDPRISIRRDRLKGGDADEMGKMTHNNAECVAECVQNRSSAWEAECVEMLLPNRASRR